MWTATIVSKDYNKGTLHIGVEYTDGNLTFSESIDMTGGTPDTLDSVLQNRLTRLNVTENLALSLDVETLSTKTIAMLPVSSVEKIQP